MADDGALVVVAIDGPAGSGKSTVARRLAEELKIGYLDTGAMYRAVTFAVLAGGLDPEDTDSVARLAEEVKIELGEDGTTVVDGTDATIEIRGPQVSQCVSVVANNPQVRSELVSRQRQWARSRGGGVLEGRDIGSVVFPDADLKIYLTASPEVRAQRRAGEARRDDTAVVAADLARRDAYDSQRENDPLRQVDDAVVVDTSDMSIDEVVVTLKDLLAESVAASGG